MRVACLCCVCVCVLVCACPCACCSGSCCTHVRARTQTNTAPPAAGSLLVFNRARATSMRRDGYEWQKKPNSDSVRVRAVLCDAMRPPADGELGWYVCPHRCGSFTPSSRWVMSSRSTATTSRAWTWCVGRGVYVCARVVGGRGSVWGWADAVGGGSVGHSCGGGGGGGGVGDVPAYLLADRPWRRRGRRVRTGALPRRE